MSPVPKDLEDYFGFLHGMSAGVAATSLWEALRCLMEGVPLLLVGVGASMLVVHVVHLHHKKVTRAHRITGRHRRR